MQISFLSLFKDSQNFVRNQLTVIAFTILCAAGVTELITLFFLPNLNMLPIQEIAEKANESYGDYSMQSIRLILEKSPVDQQKMLVNVVFTYLVKYLVVTLINMLITTVVILCLIWQLASSHPLNIKTLLAKAVSFIPSILLFVLLGVPYFVVVTMIGAAGGSLMLFLLVLSSLLYFTIYTLFLAYIIDNPSGTWIHHIKSVMVLLKRQFRVILPMICLWLSTLIVLHAILPMINQGWFIKLIINFIGLFIYFFLLTYFYRLCSLNR